MSIEHNLETPLAEAVRAAGSQSAFGRLIGRRQSTVRDWLVLNKLLPAQHVLTVEASTGVSRHALRPDVFPLAESAIKPTHKSADLTANGVPVESSQEALAA